MSVIVATGKSWIRPRAPRRVASYPTFSAARRLTLLEAMDETVHIAFQMAEQVDAAEQGITRLCIAWLAMNSGVESEFGYKSQRELITAFTQVLDNYKDAYNAMLAAGGEEMEEAVRL